MLSPTSLALLSYLNEGHVPRDHSPELLGCVHVPDVGLGEGGRGLELQAAKGLQLRPLEPLLDQEAVRVPWVSGMRT